MQWLRRVFNPLLKWVFGPKFNGRVWCLENIGHPHVLKGLLDELGEVCYVYQGVPGPQGRGFEVLEDTKDVYFVNVKTVTTWGECQHRIHHLTNRQDDRRPYDFLLHSGVGQALLELVYLGLHHFLEWHACMVVADTLKRPTPHFAYGVWDFSEPSQERRYTESWVLWHSVADGIAYGIEVPQRLLFAAVSESPAMLSAAYRHRCPGIDPNSLLLWRCFQKRPSVEGAAEIRSHVLRSAAILEALAAEQMLSHPCSKHQDRPDPECDGEGGCWFGDRVTIVDVTKERDNFLLPELEEAAIYAGLGYTAGSDQDRRWILGGIYTEDDKQKWFKERKLRGHVVGRFLTGALLVE